MVVKIAMGLPLPMLLSNEVMFAQALLSETDCEENLPCQSTLLKAKSRSLPTVLNATT
jgi:hypothetical protein